MFVDADTAASDAAGVDAARQQSDVDVYVVDPAEDGIAAISDAVEEQGGYDRITVIGRGTGDGDTVALGTASLSADGPDTGDAWWGEGTLTVYDQADLAQASDGEFVDSGWMENNAVEPTFVLQTQDGDDTTSANDDVAAESGLANAGSKSVVFVDTSIENYESLIDQVDPEAEIALIDSQRDGVSQISEYLAGREGIEAIHIVSHGREGALSLGTATLDSASINGAYADDLQAIGASLSESGDILIYGCDFTGGEEGAAAAALLAERTGADIAASNDDTGHASLNSDWDLETHVGDIDAEAIAATGWHGRLAPSIDLDFSGTPTLVSGNAGQPGAVYRYADVADGVDALVTIDAVSNAQVSEFDANANGVAEGFSPTIQGQGANGFAQFSFQFVESGTTNARVVSFTSSSLDVDNTVETIQFRGTSSYTVEGNTYLTVNVDSANNNVNIRGGGPGAFPTSRNDTRYIVSANYTDVTGFTYRAGVDGNASRQTALLFENVDTGNPGNINYNDPQTTFLPAASDDQVVTSENTPLTFQPQANDGTGAAPTTISQINGQAISAGGPPVTVGNGTVALNAGGELIYTPNTNFGGTDTFTYTIQDANGRTSTASVEAVIDNDRDGVANVDDIDDDNDGILDTDEGLPENVQTGAWSLNGRSATMDLGNGVIVRATGDGTTNFTANTFNPLGTDFWSKDLAGDDSLATVFGASDSITFSFEDADGNPVEVVNPVIHLDRIGGANGNQNSSVLTLRNGSWVELAGTDDFASTANTVQDGGAGTPTGLGYSAESSGDDASGTAAGSLQLNGVVSSFTLDASLVGPVGDDGIEFIIEAASPVRQDSDGDGLADHLDIDKDNDGITDNVEAQTTADYIAPSGVGGTAAFRDANGDGLDDNYAGGLTEVDTDGDEIVDTLDADSDNDGQLDIDEAGHAAATLTNADADGDGLDDAFDTVSGFDVNDDNVAGDNGGADGDYTRFTLRDGDGDTNANEAVPNRTSNDAAPPVADLDYRDNVAAIVAEADTGTTDEDVTLNVDASSGLLSNDQGAAGQVLVISEYSVDGRTVAVDPVAGGTTTINGVGTLTIRADGAYDFVPAANYNGAVPQVTYTVVTGAAGRTTGTLDITVTPVDDAPQNNIPGTQTVPEDSVITFARANDNAISIQDVDSDTATVTLTASDGSLTLSGTTGLTFTDGDGTNDAAMTFSGSLADINAALEGAQLSPTPDYVGNATLTVETGSGTPALTDTDTLQISYTPVADIVDDAASTGEDTAVNVDVLANDSFENPEAVITAVDGQALVAGGAAVGVSNGSVQLLANGQLRFTPDADFNGDTSFNYTVGTANNSETATVTVTVDPANDAPVVSDPLPDRSGQDGGPLSVATAGAFSDVDADTLSYSATGLPDGLTIDADTGEITGRLPSDASLVGPYTVQVTASDGQGGSVTDTFVITSRNVAPTANADEAETGENAAVAGNVIAGDGAANGADVDGGDDADTLVVSQVGGDAANVGEPVTGSGGGTFIVDANGDYSFDPGTDFDYLAAGEPATTQVSYEISDGQGGTDITTLTVTVTGTNDAPVVATPLEDQAGRDGDVVSVFVDGAFTDIDATDTLTYTVDNLPLGLSIDANTGEISGALAANASQDGPYTVTVTATDGAGEQAVSAFTWRVTNPAPVASADMAMAAENGTVSGNVIAGDADGNGADVDGVNDSDDLDITRVGGDADAVGIDVPGDNGGTFTIDENGDYTFTAGGDFEYLSSGETATTRVTYTVSDGQGGTDTSVLTVVVTGANDAPAAQPVPDQTGTDGESANFPTAGFFDDADANDTPIYTADGLPPGLTIDSATGVISGQFANGASQGGPNDDGIYNVTVFIDDDNGGTAQTTFTWTVGNAPVTGVDDTDNATEDAGVSRAAADGVLANDNDPDGDNLSVIGVENAAGNVGAGVIGSNGGTFTINADGSYSFEPGTAFQYLAEGENATTSVVYQVSDSEGGTDMARLTVTVAGVNDAPTLDFPLEDLSNTDGETVSVPTAGAFSDIDANDDLSFAVTGLPDGLTFDPNTGEISGMLDADASQGGDNGAYTVTVTVNDGNGGTATDSFVWAIANRAPVADNDAAPTTEGAAAISGNVLDNDTDGAPDTDALTVSQVNAADGNVGAGIRGSNGGTFTVNADGTYSFDGNGEFERLAEGETATTSVVYQVSDGQGGTDTATLTVTVTGTNDAPVVRTPLADLASNDGDTVSVPAAGAFQDADTNDELSYSAEGLPAGLTINSETGVISGAIDAAASQTNGGIYSIIVTADDNNGGTVTDTFTWNITNRRPVAADDVTTTTENAAVSGNVIDGTPDGDADVDGAGDTDTLTVAQVGGDAGGVGNAVVGGNGGTFTIDINGNYSFDPGTDFDDLAVGETRDTSVTYQITDGQGGTDIARLTVTVTGENDAPVVANEGLQNLASNDGETVSVPTAGAFDDVDTNDTLTYSAELAGENTLPPGLQIDPNTGVITGTLDNNASENTPYTVTITVTDSQGESTTSTFDWSIDNEPVQAVDDTGATTENAVTSGNVVANDNDPDDDPFEVVAVGGDAGAVDQDVIGSNGGTFSIDADGNYSFDPGTDFDYLAEGEQATTSVTYQIQDADGDTDQARLTIRITGTNDAPEVVRTPAPVSSNDGEPISVPTAGSFDDIDEGDTLAYTVSGLPAGLTINEATGEITGSIEADASQGGPDSNGVYSVTVTATDGGGEGEAVSTTFAWTVANRPPIAVNDAGAATVGGTATGNVIDGAADGGADRDGGLDDDPLSVFSVAGDVANVSDGGDTVSVAGDNGGTFVIAADGSYTFDPGADFDDLGPGETATTTVLYEVTDDQGGTDEARLTITVTGVNDAPTVVNGGIDAQSNNDGEDVSLPTAQAFDDADANDTLTYSANVDNDSTLPPGLEIDSVTGRITGTLSPNASQLGDDGSYTVTITATDSTGAAVSTDFIWTVANTAPVAVNDSDSADENQTVSGNVIAGAPDAAAGGDRDGGDDTDTLTVVDVDGAAIAAGGDATVTGDLGGAFTLDSDGNYSFDPGDNFDYLAAGETAITGVTYTVSDGQGGTDTARLTVTITGTNDAPTVANALPDLAANDGDTANIATADAFADVDANDALTYSATGLPDGISISAATGEITGVLAADASQGGPNDDGVYTVVVTASDGSAGGTVSDTFTWTIDNPAPMADNDIAATGENVDIARDAATGVLANDADGNSDTDELFVAEVGGDGNGVGQAVAGSNGGLFTVNRDGSYDFAPGTDFDDLAAGESRDTAVTYQVSDGQGETATARIVITVNGANDAPTVANELPDRDSRDGDSVTASVAGTFADLDASDELTYSANVDGESTLPPGLSLDPGTGRITGTLDADASDGAPYTVVITATDLQNASVQTSFTWTVTNPGPIAAPDTADTQENDAFSVDAANGVLANDVDGGNDTDALEVTLAGADADNLAPIADPVAGSEGGTFTLNGDGSYTFDPGTDFDDLAVDDLRSTQITYQVSDAQGATATETLTVTVTGTNDGPTVVAPVDDVQADDGDAISVTTADAFADIDGDTLTYTAAGLPPGLAIDSATGEITGTLSPDASQNDPVEITVTANDGNATTSTSFTLTSTNVVPVAAADLAETDENIVTSGNVIAGDANGVGADTDGGNDTDTLTATTLGGQPVPPAGSVTVDGTGGGSFTLSANGDYSFDPGADFDDLAVDETRTASVAYEVSDGQGGTATSTISVTVRGTNDAPTVVGDGLPNQNANDGDTVSIETADAFADADISDILTYSATGLPAGLDIDPDTGLITGTLGPDASDNGPFTITVTADDGNEGTASSTFTLAAANVDPVARDDSGNTPERDPLSGDVLANDNDGGQDTDALTVSQVNGETDNIGTPVAGSDGGTFTIGEQGQYVFNPGTDFADLGDGQQRDTSVSYQIDDGQGGTAVATLTVTVTGGNDAPVVDAPTPDQSYDDGEAVSIAAGDAFIDAEGDDLSFFATAADANGNPVELGDLGLAIDPDTGEITGALVADASAAGPYAVTVTALDGNGGSNSDEFALAVNNVEPIAAADTVSTDENTLATGNVLDNDADGGQDTDPLTVSQVNGEAGNVGTPTAGANGGQFTIGPDGTYSFEPGADFDDLAVGESRTTTISYEVSDGNGGTDTATLTVTVNGTNDAPAANADSNATSENIVLSGDVLANDADADVTDTLVVSQVNGDSNGVGSPVGAVDGGQFTINADGSYDFDPKGDFDDLAVGESRTTTISYQVSDGNGGFDTAVLTVTVNGTNDGPVAVADTNTTTENVAVSGDVLANDTDVDASDVLVVSQVNGDPNGVGTPVQAIGGGQFTIDADGTYSFDPNGDFDDLAVGESRTTQVNYQVDDGNGGLATTTLTVTVNGSNDVPSAVADINATTENVAASGDVLANDTDVDASDVLTVTQVNGTTAGVGAAVDVASGGRFTINADGSYDFDPDGDFDDLAVGESRTTQVNYQVDDGNGGTDTATLTVTVNGTNDVPVAAADANATSENVSASGNVLANDTDADANDTLAVSQINGDPNGVGSPVDAVDGGQFTINADGSYDFDPDGDFDDLAVGESRTTTISYQVSDGNGGFDTAVLTVTVNGTNDAPVADADSNATSENIAVSGDVLANDADADVNDTLVVSQVNGDSNGVGSAVDAVDGGQFTINADGSYDFDPNGDCDDLAVGESRTTTISYQVSDGNGGFDTAVLTVTVNGTNDAPVAVADTNAASEDAVASGDVLANDTDVDASDVLVVSQVNGDPAGVGSPVNAVNGGQFTVNADGSYDFDPNGDFDDLAVGESRTSTVTYQVSDGNGGTDTTTLTVTVTGANDAPIVTAPLADQDANDGDTVAISTAGAFTDTDTNDTLTYSAEGLPDGLEIDPATGLITGTLAADASQAGPYTITVTADDGNGGTVSDSFDLTAANVAPTAGEDTASVGENGAATGNVLVNDVDGGNDTDPLTVSQINGDPASVGTPVDVATGGRFTINADGSYSFDTDGDFDDLAVGESRPTTITYQVSDGNGGTETATLTVTVNGSNDGPVAVVDTNTTSENVVANGDVLANDTDTDGSDILTVAQVNGDSASVGVPVDAADGGQFTVNADGSYSFDPGADFDDLAVGESRTTTVDYQVTDSNGGTDTTTLTVTVTGTNDAPVVTTPLENQTANDGDTVSVPTADAFTDVDTNDTLTYSAAGLPDGLVIDPATGLITGMLGADASQNGPYTITVTADDGNGGTVDSSFVLQVNNVPPAAADDVASTPENALTSGNVLGNDTDGDNDPLTVTRINGDEAGVGSPIAGANGGQFTVNADGSYDFDPGADFDDLAVGESRTTTVNYQVSDGNGGVDTAVLTVTVNGRNDGPTAVADTATTDERTAANGNVLGNDADPDTSDILMVAQVNGVSASVGVPVAGSDGGQFTINADGSYDFQPNGAFDDLAAGESRTTSVSYQADDGNGGTSTTTLTITVNGVNNAPVAAADSDSVTENAVTDGNVLTNDTDADVNDELTVAQVNGDGGNVGTPVAGVGGGQFTVNGDGTYSFDPNGDFDDLAVGETATTRVNYQVSDGNGGTDTATLTVTVNGTNDVPTAGDDAVTTVENTPVTGNVLANDADPDASDVLTVAQVGGDAGNVGTPVAGVGGGQFTVNGDGTYSFDPNGDFDDLAVGESATTTISYQVSDGNGGTDTASITVTVSGANDVPVAAADSDTVTENAVTDGNVLTNDTDADGNDILTVSQINGDPASVGTPVAGANGGQFTVNGDGTYSFDPNGDFDDLAVGESRTTRVNYQVSDGNGGTDTAVLTVTVNGTNDVPTAGDDVATANENTPATGNVLANDTDADLNDTLTVSQVNGDPAGVGTPVASATGGQFTINADGSYSFDPNGDFDDLAAGESRTTTISYQVSDGNGGTDTATITVTVNGANDAPIVDTPLAAQASNDGDTVSVATADSFTDVDGDPLTYSATNLPPGLSIDADTGVISGTIDNDASVNVAQDYNVTVTATDPSGQSDSSDFVWTVSNLAPTTADDVDNVAEDASITRDAGAGVLANDSDTGTDTDPLIVGQINGDAASVGAPVRGDNGGQFTVNADGSYTFASNGDFEDLGVGESRTSSVTYQADDGNGGTQTATLTVTVAGANDAPVVDAPLSPQTANDGETVSVPTAGAFTDADANDVLTYSAGDTLPPGLSINPATGEITGTIDGDASVDGPYEVTITATDQSDTSVSSTFTWTVNNVDPVANNDNDEATEGATINRDADAGVLANDGDVGTDTDLLNVSEVNGESGNVGAPIRGTNGGQFTVRADGSYEFATGADFEDLAVGETRETTLTYTADDGNGGTDTATLTVVVTGTNDGPVVDAPLPDRSSNDGKDISVDASAAFTDVDGDTLRYSVTGLPDGLVIDPDTGIISGRISNDASQIGSYDVTVTATDPSDEAITSSFVWTVNNLAPMATNDTDTTTENVVVSSAPGAGVLVNDGDTQTDFDNLTVSRVNGDTGAVGASVTGANGGQFTINEDGSYEFDPNGDFDDLAVGESRSSSVTYQADDGDGGVATATFTVTVTGTNDAPVAAADNDSVTENAVTDGNVLTNDTDADVNDELTVAQVNGDAGNVGTPVAGVGGGQFTVNADGTYSFDPNGDFDDLAVGESATATVEYQVSDGNGGTDTATLTVTVNGTNDVPVAGDDAVTTDENVAANGNVLGNDTDTDGNDVLTVAQVGGDAGNVGTPTAGANGGQFTIGPDGTYSFEPGADFDDLAIGESRTTTISYQVSDGNGGTDTATLTVTVNGTNDAPVAAADNDSVTENAVTDGNVLTNDTDADVNDELTVAQVNGDAGNLGTPVAGVGGGQFTVNGDGTYSFDPNGDFDDLAVGESATATVEYQVSDGNGGTDTATLTVTVNGTNDVPVAGDDAVTTAENVAANGNVLGNDTDTDGNDVLTVAQVGGDAGNVGTPTAGANGGQFTIGPDGTYSFEPGADFDDLAIGESRTTTISYQVSDGNGGTDTATLTVTVNGTNDAPVVDTPLNDQVADDGDTVSISTAGAFNDPDGETLTYGADGLPAGLSIDPATGLVTGTLAPDASQDGPYNVTITATDPNGSTVSDSFLLTPANVAPVAGEDAVSADENTPATGNVLANDTDGGSDSDPLTVSQVDGDPAGVGTPVNAANGGQFTINADGTYSFDPNGDFDDLAVGESRTTTISYQVADGNGGFDTATLTVTVNGSNDVPVANDDVASADENTPVTGNALANDTDADTNDDLSVAQVDGDAGNVGTPTAGSDGGQFTINADGTYSFDPNGEFGDLGAGESRTTTISYQVSDGNGGTDTATITVTVNGLNQGPSASDIPDGQTPFGSDYSNDVSDAFADNDLNDTLTYGAEGLPAGLSIDPDTGVISGEPVGIGAFDITVTATDSTGAQVSETFTLRVLPPAVAADIANVGAPAGPSSGAAFDGGSTLVSGGFIGYSSPMDTSISRVELTIPEGIDNDPLSLGLPDGPIASSVEPVNLRYQATESDGSPLPGTLTVNSSTGELTGSLPPGMDRARITIIAIDDNGNTRPQEVWVDANGNILEAGANARDDAAPLEYRRVEVRVGIDGQVIVESIDDAGNTMRAESIRVDGNYLDIQIFDPESSDVSGYTATLSNGDPLPDGLAVDRDTGRITGEVPAGLGTLSFRIEAQTADNVTRVLEIEIDRSGAGGDSTAWQTLDAQVQEALASSGDVGEAAHGARIAAALRFN
ncbi:Ig-like domain-containing protein [Salinisphaera dokdonensis]